MGRSGKPGPPAKIGGNDSHDFTLGASVADGRPKPPEYPGGPTWVDREYDSHLAQSAGVESHSSSSQVEASLRDRVSAELKRTPITSISAAAAVVIAALTLVLAWFQYRAAPLSASPATSSAISPPAEILLGNVLLVIAYFLAITVAASLLLRIVARGHDITALFVSIPLIALTNFTVILLIYLAPPRAPSRQLFSSAHDLVFYASAAIVIAFCGAAILKDLASSITTKKDESEAKRSNSGDGFGILLVVLVLLGLWSWLVFAGQTRLTRTLLPEIAHPADTNASTAAPNNTVERDAPKTARPSP